MNNIKQIIELAEHPERFTEEQMAELLSNEENMKLYLTVSETMMALEEELTEAEPIAGLQISGGTTVVGKEKKPPRIIKWAAAACVVAAIGFAAPAIFDKIAHKPQNPVAENHAKKTQVHPRPILEQKTAESPDAQPESQGTTAPIPVQTLTPEPAKRNVLASVSAEPRAKVLRPASTEITEPEADLSAKANQPHDDIDVDRIVKLQQARIDNEMATSNAERIIAEHYARQVANLEEPSLPAVNSCFGDDCISSPNIMTLIMQ